MTDANTIRDALEDLHQIYYERTQALAALDRLVSSRGTLERERDVALDRITTLENDVEQLKRTVTQLRAQVASSVRRTYQ